MSSQTEVARPLDGSLYFTIFSLADTLLGNFGAGYPH